MIGGALLAWPAGAATTELECRLSPGVAPGAVVVGEDVRTYHVVVGPDAGKQGRPPLLLAWHGFGATVRGLLDRLDILANWPDAIIVVPEGLPRRLGDAGGPARAGWQIAEGELDDRDLRLFDALLPRLEKRYCVDPSRVYSTGFSNGAMLSNLLGCLRGEKLAAIAPVGGKGPDAEQCGPPVPVRLTHGKADERVPYADALATAKRWAEINGCAGSVDAKAEGCVRVARCKAPVEICTLPGGHEWPKEISPRLIEFLKAQSRPE